MFRNLHMVHADPGNTQLPGERGPRIRKRTVATRDAALTGKNASFSRKSRFKEEHFKIEFADRQLIRRGLIFLWSFIFLTFSDPFVDVCFPLHRDVDTSVYSCRIKEVYRVVEEKVIDGTGESQSVVAQLRFCRPRVLKKLSK